MIDLSRQSDQVQKWMDENIPRFLAEHPTSTPTTIGLYCSPVNGWVSLCFDVSKDLGYPSMRCPDFAYPEFALLEFPEWRDNYESESPMIKRHDSKIIRFKHEEGDEVFNRPFFDFLMRMINDYYHSSRDVFRPIGSGVQILDSRCISFGRTHLGKNT